MTRDYVGDRLTAAKYAETVVEPTVKEAVVARDRRHVFVAAIVTDHLADYLAADIVAKEKDIKALDDKALNKALDEAKGHLCKNMRDKCGVKFDVFQDICNGAKHAL